MVRCGVGVGAQVMGRLRQRSQFHLSGFISYATKADSNLLLIFVLDFDSLERTWEDGDHAEKNEGSAPPLMDAKECENHHPRKEMFSDQ